MMNKDAATTSLFSLWITCLYYLIVQQMHHISIFSLHVPLSITGVNPYYSNLTKLYIEELFVMNRRRLYVTPHQHLWTFDILVCPAFPVSQPHVTAVPSLSIFCCRLKSHLFSLSYPALWLLSFIQCPRSDSSIVFTFIWHLTKLAICRPPLICILTWSL